MLGELTSEWHQVVSTAFILSRGLGSPSVTIVAVGDRERGVIPPCGRCRQILLDLHPDMAIIVPLKDGELTAQPVPDLLTLGRLGLE